MSNVCLELVHGLCLPYHSGAQRIYNSPPRAVGSKDYRGQDWKRTRTAPRMMRESSLAILEAGLYYLAIL